jgi:hypothetical protein
MDIRQTLNNIVKKSTTQKAFCMVTMLFSSLCHALPSELPAEFSATYTLESHGIDIARATYTLEHESNGLKFTQNSKTTGFASLIKNESLQETSYLSLQHNQLLLNEYSYIQKGDDKNRDINLKIDWIISDNKLSGRVRGTARDEPVKFKVNKPVWDTLSSQLPLMMNTNDITSEWEAALLVKGQLKDYTFVTLGKEEISVGGRKLKTYKVERKNNNNDKPIFFWVAPELLNLPVKIEKWKKGKAYITMSLETATFPSNIKLQFKAIEIFDDL